jgi:hypothetical protein
MTDEEIDTWSKQRWAASEKARKAGDAAGDEWWERIWTREEPIMDLGSFCPSGQLNVVAAAEAAHTATVELAIIRDARQVGKPIDVILQRAKPPRPSDRVSINVWVAALVHGMADAPRGDALQTYINAVTRACRDLPAGVWTRGTLAEARRTFSSWPSGASIYRLLRPHGERLLPVRLVPRRCAP